MQSAFILVYCHLWPFWLYQIFPHYPINSPIVGKKLLHIKYIWFSLQILSETFLILSRIQQDIINVRRSSSKVPSFFCQTLVRLESSRQTLEKSSNIKFHENPFSGGRVFSCGQTDMTKLIIAFLNVSNAP
jgi:hypothetical protein